MSEQFIKSALERVGRRILTMIGRGRKTTGNDAGNVQLLQVKLGANEVHDNTPRLAEFGFTSMPPDGSDLIVLFVGGDRSNGIIIASGHIATRMKNLQPGESALYDSIGKHVYLKSDQIEINAQNQPVNIINATTVTVDASSNVTINVGGNVALNVTGNINSNAAQWTHSGPVTIDGNVLINGSENVTGMITGEGGLGISGGSGASVNGSLTTTGNVTANGISLDTHTHSGVYPGGGSSGGPQ